MSTEQCPDDVFVNYIATPGQLGPSVRYNTESHIQVLCQMHASVWKKVFIFCVINALFAVFVQVSEIDDILHLSIGDKGHVFMSLMVSYLVVTRSHNSLSRYMAARGYLSNLMRGSRELIQHVVAFSRYTNNDTKGMEWRIDVAKRTISFLRTIVANLQYPTKGIHVWEVAGLSKLEKQAMILAVGRSNERSPLVLHLFLRSIISSHVKKLNTPLEVVQEMMLLEFTSDLVSAYSNIMKDVTTPYPFPLVQMSRTFLFAWVITLPLALSNDIENPYPLFFVVFFLTYGFLGLEFISIEMDDPYGDDPNDFNVVALANVVYNDILVCIHDIDGEQAAAKVNRSLKIATKVDLKTIDENFGYNIPPPPQAPFPTSVRFNIFKDNEQVSEHDDCHNDLTTPQKQPNSPEKKSNSERSVVSESSIDKKKLFEHYQNKAIPTATQLDSSSNSSYLGQSLLDSDLGGNGAIIQNAAGMTSDTCIEVLGLSPNKDNQQRLRYKNNKLENEELESSRSLSVILDNSITLDDTSEEASIDVSKDDSNNDYGFYNSPMIERRNKYSSMFDSSLPHGEIMSKISETLDSMNDDLLSLDDDDDDDDEISSSFDNESGISSDDYSIDLDHESRSHSNLGIIDCFVDNRERKNHNAEEADNAEGAGNAEEADNTEEADNMGEADHVKKRPGHRKASSSLPDASALINKLRERGDSDDSIQIMNNDEKVRLDTGSLTLHSTSGSDIKLNASSSSEQLPPRK